MVTDEAIRLGVDVGGTFTDVVVLAEGELTSLKVPTTDDQSEGVLNGIDRACERARIDPEDIEQFRHAMTVATNAMLESDGATTALVTTAGFGDVLAIGRQNRPSLYDPTVSRPEPLIPAHRRHEIDERATPAGIEKTPDDSALERLVEGLADEVESIAISFLHADVTPENERAVRSFLSENTDTEITTSHETLQEFREYERTATTAADAYVTPVIASYLDRLAKRATARGLPTPRVMQSNGGIADAGILSENAVRTILSGPAAGVVGASLFEDQRHEGIITFDMGGTSTDVGLVRDGSIERTTTAAVGGYPVHVPMVDVETVGAGGGSIAWIDDGGALRVGPDSAGAEPGPACYGKGGTEPTVTDANLLLGYLGGDATLGGTLPLQTDAARDALAALAETADLDSELRAARGVCRVANERMARAIRAVTVERGHDPRDFELVAFGGAGPMHAAFLAETLGIEEVTVPRANGVLSALGLLAADQRHDASRTHRRSFADVDPDAVEAQYQELTDRLQATTDDPRRAVIDRRADVRYAGQSHELTVDVPVPFVPETVEAQFHDTHERRRGYRLEDEAVELVTIRATATVRGSSPDITHEGNRSESKDTRRSYFDEAFVETPVYDRTKLPVGTSVEGPAIFEGGESTVVVPPDWHVSVDNKGTLELEVAV